MRGNTGRPMHGLIDTSNYHDLERKSLAVELAGGSQLKSLIRNNTLPAYVDKAMFNAHTIIAAVTDDTPVALTISEQTIIGRKTSGNIAALTGAEVMAILSAQATAAFSFNSQNLTGVGTINTHTIPGGTGTIALVSDITTHAALTATHGATGAIVGTTNEQTLTLKTLTTPVIASLYQDAGKTKLLTMPAATDTLVGRDTTDTLTNKTLTSPAINGTVTTTGMTLPYFDTDAEVIAGILKGSYLMAPPMSGWTASTSSTAVVSQSLLHQCHYTSISSSQYTLSHTGIIYGLAYSYYYYSIDWTKKMYFMFGISRKNSDTEFIGRIQLKTVNTRGALADFGIGLRIDNLSLMGESYGTGLGVVDLSTTMSYELGNLIAIVLTPGASRTVKWYVNGVLKGTQTDTSKIPGANADKLTYITISVENGATGGVNCLSWISNMRIWQQIV